MNNDKEMVTIKKRPVIDVFVPIIALFMFVYLPTSSNSRIYGIKWTISVWLLAAMMVFLLLISNKRNRSTYLLVIVLGIVLYMTAITIITLQSGFGARLSLARIAPFITVIILFSLRIDSNTPFSIMKKLMDIFFVTMIVVNVLTVIGNSTVQEFIGNHYWQYYENALYYSIFQNKPVFTFGVHSYAAYFYMIFYYLSYRTAIITSEKKYFFYCAATIVITFLLTSNSSIVYATIMALMFLKLFPIKPLTLSGYIALAGILLIMLSSYLIDNYTEIMNSDLNGFIARYTGSVTVFDANMSFIWQNYAIGFTIIDYLNYSDSGYILYLTMGNIPLVVSIYLLAYTFIKNNIPQSSVSFITFIVLSFEIALPATFNYRFIYAIIFVVYYLRSLDKHRLMSNMNKNLINENNSCSELANTCLCRRILSSNSRQKMSFISR